MSSQFKDINILKGIAILLVVLGHIHEHDGPGSWIFLRTIIYSFHMPIFFVVSGFLFANSASKKNLPYADHARKTIKRYAVPFLSFTVIIMSYKLAIQSFAPNISLGYPATAEKIIWHFLNPQYGFAVLLWFLYSLLLIQLTYPFLKKAFKSDSAILAAFILIGLIPITPLFTLNLVAANYPFFIIGAIAFRSGFHKIMSSRAHITIAAASILLFFVLFFEFRNLPLVPIMLGTCGTCLAWLASVYLAKVTSHIITYVGTLSLDIYLWHTTIIGIVGIAVRHLTNTGFWEYTLIVFISSVLILIAIGTAARRIPLAQKLLYGR